MLLRMWSHWNSHMLQVEVKKKNMATLKNSLAFFKIKSNMQLPYNPTFPLPGIYPREMKTYVHNIFQNVHRALLIIISNGKQPKYLSTDE